MDRECFQIIDIDQRLFSLIDLHQTEHTRNPTYFAYTKDRIGTHVVILKNIIDYQLVILILQEVRNYQNYNVYCN